LNEVYLFDYGQSYSISVFSLNGAYLYGFAINSALNFNDFFVDNKRNIGVLFNNNSLTSIYFYDNTGKLLSIYSNPSINNAAFISLLSNDDIIFGDPTAAQIIIIPDVVIASSTKSNISSVSNVSTKPKPSNDNYVPVIIAVVVPSAIIITGFVVVYLIRKKNQKSTQIPLEKAETFMAPSTPNNIMISSSTDSTSKNI